MKTYLVTHYYTMSKTYVVKAESEDQASDAPWGDNRKPDVESEWEFCDEYVVETDQTGD